MPSIDDIAKVAEALEKSPVIVIRDRCVAVRNRNASCRKCVAACAKRAITVIANDVSISAASCVGCGACISVCPTEAMVAANPAWADVRAAAIASVGANDGRAAIACARIASKRQADPARFAEVPCLARFDEVLACELAAQGASSILLVDGNCATCKNRDCASALDDSVDQAEALLAAHGIAMAVKRVTGFPEEMRAESTEGLFGSTRRGFFSEAAAAARETAKTAAKTTLESELGYRVEEPSIGERLRVGANGTLPQLRMPRHEAALNALYSIRVPESDYPKPSSDGTSRLACDQNGSSSFGSHAASLRDADEVGGMGASSGPGAREPSGLQSRLFGAVSIDVAKCNSCGMCAVFCPTGALVRDAAENPSAPLRYFEFQAADCVNCGLCADVCWKGALSIDPGVAIAELYDFEPRTIELKTARKKKL